MHNERLEKIKHTLASCKVKDTSKETLIATLADAVMMLEKQQALLVKINRQSFLRVKQRNLFFNKLVTNQKLLRDVYAELPMGLLSEGVFTGLQIALNEVHNPKDAKDIA